MTINRLGLLLSLPLVLWCGVASGALVAEYRFDADRWQNVSGEVLDSTANARHGRAIGLSTTAGLLCNSADLSAAGETDYVSLPADVLNGLNDFTLMVWYRSTYTDREMFISAANSSQVRELQWFKRNATRWQPRIKNTADGRLDASNVADGNWHHVAWTRSGGNTCLYVDGALQDCNTLSAGALNVATLFVGQELTDVSGSVRNNRGVRGTLDELYVFDQALTATEIDNIRGQSLAGNNWDGTPRLCDAAIDPIADYRFDEQSWSGVAGEVLDSGANAYHGVSIGATVAADGLLCRAGDFSATGTEHVSLDAGALDGLGDFTLSLWGRTGSTASWQTLVSGANAGTTNELVMLFDSASQFYPGISITFFADAAEISSATFNDNNWHHFVWTRDTSANRSCFYLDGNLQGCSNHPSAADADPLQIDPNGFVLGQDQDSVGGGFETSQAWNGLLDELLVFDRVLSDALIAQIFTNQSAGANWDGTERTCQLTPRAEYRFDAATWNGNPGEVLDSGADALHGTASQVSPVTGLVCNAADFSAAGTADYVSLDYRALDGLTNFTVSLWVNSANVNNKALISGARAGQSNALIYWYNNASLFGGYVDNSAAFVQGNNVFDGQWHHLVWVRSGTQHCLYTDGALRGCATGSGVTLDVDAGGLILGQEQDSLGGGFVASQAMTGLMDELLIFDLALDAAGINSIYQNQLAGLNWDGTTRTCPVVAANRLQVIHDGSGIHCAAETVGLRALDLTGNPVTNYSQTVQLDTTTGRGSWQLLSGNGVLQDTTLDDGLATYTFASADAGQVTLVLDYADGTPLVDVDVSQLGNSSVRDNDSEGPLTFAPSGFTLTANPLPNPPPSPLLDPLPAQVAGQAFALHISAYGTTPTDRNCGVIESFQGAKTLQAWQSLVDPGTGVRVASLADVPVGTAAATAQPVPVTFVAGQATVAAKYKDVGALRLHLSDQSNATTPFSGATNTFVSRPADIQVSAVRTTAGVPNPAATTATGPGFVSAGSPFTVIVDVLDAEGDLTPNYGREAVAEGLQIESAQLQLPAGGRNGSADDGSLGGATAFAPGLLQGRFANDSAVFDESGIVRLRASIADGDYMGAGAPIGTLSEPVGRFFPDRFTLHNARVQAACNGFTYMDQPQLGVFYAVQADNTLGQPLFNYDDTLLGSGATAVVGHAAEHADSGVDLAGRVSPGTAVWQSGQYLIQQPSAVFNRVAAPDGPYDDLVLGVRVADALDNRQLAGLDMHAAAAGNCVAAGNCSARRIGSSAVYYGRLLVLPAFGAESADLDIGAEAQVFNGAGFVEHALDDCTTYQSADLNLTNYSGNLQAADTGVIGPLTSQPLVAGQVNTALPPLLQAPGLGNEGSVQVSFDVAAWLRFSWQGGAPQNPSAPAVFGSYRGHQRIIYWAQDP